MSEPFNPKSGAVRMITAENAHEFRGLTPHDLATIHRDGGIAIMDARAMLQLMAHCIHEDGNPRAVEWLNQYCALARQRGCPELSARRLKEAAFQEGGGQRFLRWLDRTAKYLSEVEFCFEVLKIPRPAP